MLVKPVRCTISMEMSRGAEACVVSSIYNVYNVFFLATMISETRLLLYFVGIELRS